MLDTIQRLYSPTDYDFRFTDDWYEWDFEAGRKAALAARNAEVKRLRAEGYKVKAWSMPNQLISKGGIGTGKPHIEEVVTVYALDAYK